MTDTSHTSASLARGFTEGRIVWPLVMSGDLFELKYGRALTVKDRNPGPVPVYGTNGRAGWHDKALFRGPGVVLGRKGMGNLGVEWSEHDYWVIDTAYSLAPRGIINLQFAYYLLKYVGLNHLKEGTSNPSLSRETFATQAFPFPPLTAQRGIAATLGALDDKIDSNRRSVDILDALSRAEFAQWRSGDVSRETRTFGEFADVYGGATPKTKVDEYWGGGLAWSTPTDVTRLCAPYLFETSRTITQAGLESCTAAMHPPGTIFMTSRATIGAFAINQMPATTNQGFIVVRPRDKIHRWFLFEEMRSRVDEFIANANGSTFLEISRGRFKALPLDIPARGPLLELHAVVDRLHAKAAQLEGENLKLAALRDALLPELLSGRIRVPETTEAVQEAAL